MGTFTCRCGYVIPDSTHPNELAGSLRWEDEEEAASAESFKALREFLQASAEGRRDAWLAAHFGPDFPALDDDADAIDEIYYKAGRERGHAVYRCPECGRLHVQTALYENDWICYERAE